jgi:hypothetical protein
MRGGTVEGQVEICHSLTHRRGDDLRAVTRSGAADGKMKIDHLNIGLGRGHGQLLQQPGWEKLTLMQRNQARATMGAIRGSGA